MNARPMILALLLAACGGGDEGVREPATAAAEPGAAAMAGDTTMPAADPATGEPRLTIGEPSTDPGSAGAATGDGGASPAPAAERPADRPATSPATSSPTRSDPVSTPPPPPTGEGDGGAPAPRQEVEEVLRATAARYEDVRAMQADFRQELTNTLLGRTTRSAGTLYQRQPDRFLMRFSDPAGDVIVSDGEFFWIYYPSVDPKQVIRSSRGAGGLDLRSQFVGDPVRRFEATSHGTETVAGRRTHVLTLTPRESVGYRRLKVWIDAADHLVRRFELTEENGNLRRFDLVDLRINPTLPDDLFRFTPPEGAVVVSR